MVNLSHQYYAANLSPRPVLQEIDQVTLEPGEQVLLRGISGSGKTTLLNILAGLLTPTQGQVWLNNVDIYSLSEAQRDLFRSQNIGYVFQTHYLLPNFTALENVIMPLAFGSILPRAVQQQKARQLLIDLGLGDYVNYRPGQLSTGQRMRVSMARALINEPSLILADEPTAALDTVASQMVLDLLQQTCRQNKAMLIIASHDPTLTNRFPRQLDLRAGQLMTLTEPIPAWS